jgi:diaminopimelate decarboxylase
MKDLYACPVWEPPFIQPHRIGEINKFGRRTHQRDNVVDNVFGVSVQDLMQKFGSPVYVTSEKKLRENVRHLKRAFEKRYNLVTHGWSYKTNYTSAICNILHQEGSWAEVVSEFEYEKARLLGVPGERIIFNGPNKSKRVLERAIAEGAHLHVDHLDELHNIEAVASQLGKVVPITLRLNFDTGFSEPWGKFGFNLESGQAYLAAKWVNLSPHLKLVGLHSHIGTFILEPRAYAEQVRIMCEFMREVESQGDATIDFLDIGGGFPSLNALKGIYLPPEQAVPSINDYVNAVTSALREGTKYRLETGCSLPRLIFESGRSVVDDTQVLLTTVVGTKRLADGRKAVILDAGTNLLFTAYWYNHQVKLTKDIEGPVEDTILYGPLCMNIDVVRHSIHLPPLGAGDVLVVESVGAYNNTQWMQFIEYRPNVVLVHEDEQVSIIRHAEDLSTMCAQDNLPKHLTVPFLDLNKHSRLGKHIEAAS